MPWLRLFSPIIRVPEYGRRCPRTPPLRESMALTAMICGVSTASSMLYSKRIHADSVKEPEWLGNG